MEPTPNMWIGIDVNQVKRAIILDLKITAGRPAFAGLLADIAPEPSGRLD